MQDYTGKLPFCDKLTEGELALLRAGCVVNTYTEGTYLLGDRTAQSCLGMIHILSGEIRAFIVSEEGREITLFRLGAGDNCVLSASCVLSEIKFDTQLYVTKTAEVLVIPSALFSKLRDSNIYVRCFASELMTQRFSEAMGVMQTLLFHGFDRRLARFLSEEYDRTGSREIRMTQEEIATATNSAREVVARMLKQFSADKLLESRRGVITLTDLPGLETIAGRQE